MCHVWAAEKASSFTADEHLALASKGSTGET